MGPCCAFLPRLLRIVAASRLVAALFLRAVRLILSSPPNRAQRFGWGAPFGTRLFLGLLACRHAVLARGKAGFTVGLAGNGVAIAGFAFARMKILILIHKHRRIEIHFRLLGQRVTQLIFQDRRAHFFNCAFGQVIELERTKGQADQSVHL